MILLYMLKKVILLAFLLGVVFLGVKYWPGYRGLLTANLPSKEKITDLIPEAGVSQPGENNTNLPLSIPDGYSISIFAKDLGDPRDLILDPTGSLLVSIPSQGRVVAIFDGTVETVLGGLDRPHGLAFEGTKLYVAETDGVSVYNYDPNLYKGLNGKKIIELPSGGRHFSRSILIKDSKLYVSTGSSCDTCVESDERRAAIWVANLDGSGFKPFATGLRNSVFMAVNPSTNEIWATEMGRDFLGDDIPPDEVNIVKDNQFYGWPYCWGDANPDKDFNQGGGTFNCNQSVNPQIKLQAHSAPLGLAFLGNDLLVSYHGSWNRSIPTGYKVVRFKNGVQEDFITGWISGGEVLGRPVDILVDGSKIYISDDKAGVIYLLNPLQ
jgi:glucose/arabinose dehydrogenase